MIKQITTIKKRKTYRKAGEPYVSIGYKMLYINEDAGRLTGGMRYAHIGIDIQEQRLIISKAAEETPETFKLSKVCESGYARRIETNRSLLSLIKAGFPTWMIDKRLPVTQGLDGSLIADFSKRIPIKDPAQATA